MPYYEYAEKDFWTLHLSEAEAALREVGIRERDYDFFMIKHESGEIWVRIEAAKKHLADLAKAKK